jgi:HSP20 family protein
MMNESFPSFSKDFGVELFGKSSFPKVDVVDTGTSVEIYAEIPGIHKENVEVKVEPGNILCIKGQRGEETSSDDSKKYVLRELKRSSFSRKFLLGETLDSKKVTAKFENGMLVINIPKVKTTPPEEETVKVTIE